VSGNLFARFRIAAPGRDHGFIKTSNGRTITYGNLLDQSGRYANVLSARGVTFGDRVAVQVEKSPEAILLYLACLRLGAVFLPLNSAYTLAELEHFIGDSEPQVMVCAPERAVDVAPLATRLGVATTLTLGVDGAAGTLIERANAATAEFDDVACSPDDLAAILYTSGTTGRSKVRCSATAIWRRMPRR